MPKFLITTRSWAEIEEVWSAVAPDADTARTHFESDKSVELEHICDRTLGHETDRVVHEVEAYRED